MMQQGTKHLIIGVVAFLILCPSFYLLLEHFMHPPQAIERGATKDVAANDAAYSVIREQTPITDAPVMEATNRFQKKYEVLQQPDNTGLRVPYYFFAPDMHGDDARLPLVVVLHGGPGRAYAAKFLSDPVINDRFKSFILVPVTPKGSVWSDYKDRLLFSRPEELANAVTLVKRALQQYPIDENRVYIIGCSLGGEGVFGASTYYDDIFAAGVAISGAWPVSRAENMTRMPLYIMGGTNDTVIPIEQTKAIAQAIEDAGVEVIYEEYDMGHNCPSYKYYTNDILEWLFSHSLN